MDSLAVLASCDSSFDTLGVAEGIDEAKDQTSTAVATEPTRRWAAEVKSGVVSDGEEGEDDEDRTKDKVATEPTSEGGNGKRVFRGTKPKRRGSKDGMPTVPCRKSSVMGGAQRHPSLDYLELSQFGLSIDMTTKHTIANSGERQRREDVGERQPAGVAPEK